MPFGDRELKALGNRLHARLLRESSTAVKQELSEQLLPLLTARLRRRFQNLGDPHLCETAANDALLEYFEKRQKFDPQRGDLLGYLFFNASRDLLNTIDKERREYARRKRADTPRATDDYTASQPDSPLVRRAQSQVTNDVDAEILTLLMDGVRNTAEYAEVLGIGDRQPPNRLSSSSDTKIE